MLLFDNVLFYYQITLPVPAQLITPCPSCNPLAGCPILRCPCVHDGFYMYPGNHPLNPPRPLRCVCESVCPNVVLNCSPYRQCTAEQVATYKCIKKIGEDEMLF